MVSLNALLNIHGLVYLVAAKANYGTMTMVTPRDMTATVIITRDFPSPVFWIKSIV